MPPRLRIQPPEWAGPDPDDGVWESDTPRSPLAPGGVGSLPSSPSARKTKSRAARTYHRINSLKDAKVCGQGCQPAPPPPALTTAHPPSRRELRGCGARGPAAPGPSDATLMALGMLGLPR